MAYLPMADKVLAAHLMGGKTCAHREMLTLGPDGNAGTIGPSE